MMIVLIPQRIESQPKCQEADTSNEPRYLQFTAFYQEDLQLRWKLEDSSVLGLELCAFGMT